MQKVEVAKNSLVCWTSSADWGTSIQKKLLQSFVNYTTHTKDIHYISPSPSQLAVQHQVQHSSSFIKDI